MRVLARLLLSLALVGMGASGVLAQEETSSRTVDIVEVDGIIDPPTADYIRARLDAAQDDAAVEAIVLQVDTPGGLDVSMREIVEQILGSDVPVIVWVAPRGARAASAGTFIAYAADLVFMAEATTMGAATPVDLSGGDLSTKIVNDAAEYLESLARTRDRDTGFAQDAVREGRAVDAAEAVEIGAVNGNASSLGELLRVLDGQEAGDRTLETWDEAAGAPSVTVRFQQMNLLSRLLHAVTQPEIAFALLLLGMFGIIFELYNPGIGLAGLIGGVCLLLGFYAMSVLPTNWAGVFLIVLAVILLVVDVHTAGLGAFTVGGMAALIVGALLLFSGAAPAIALAPWAIVAAVVGTLIFFISVMTAALRVRLRRPITGEDSLIGQVAEAKTDIAPEGTVFTKGTLWRARTMETGIAAGSKVEVKATEGLVLLVEPLHEHEEAPS